MSTTFWEKKDTEKERKRLQIAFHHLESFPRMKYNDQMITKGIWEYLKKT